MTLTINLKTYDLQDRLTDIDPSWKDSGKPLAVIGIGRLKRLSDRYEFFDLRGNPTDVSLSKEYVDERGNFGDDMVYFLVEYVPNNKRKLEVIPMPL